MVGYAITILGLVVQPWSEGLESSSGKYELWKVRKLVSYYFKYSDKKKTS